MPDLPLIENKNKIFKMLQQQNYPGSVFAMQDIKIRKKCFAMGKIYQQVNRV